jgi:hypothetical protein
MRGSSAKDIWLSANNGVLQHWDGINWQKFNTGIFYSLTSLWLDGTGAPWVGGKGAVADYPGAILRYIP